jgi:peptidoglycan/LPS O-acetylase OafA/YrhL
MADRDHQQYYPYFDWLRGALAMVVVLSHEGVFAWKSAGGFAVEIFFALSGWLIGGILLHTARTDLPRFFFNRSVRIWVPYYVAVALLLAVSVGRDPMTAKWREFVVYKLTFVYNLFGPPQLADHRAAMPLRGTGNHFWSVNAEEQFYLVAPLLLVVVTPRLGRNVVVWVGLAVAAWLAGVYASIVFGVLAALVADQYGPFHRTRAARAVCAAVVTGAAVGLGVGVDYYLLAPPCAIGIVLLLATSGRRGRLGAVVGGVSYPLYLNHWIGSYVAHGAFKGFGIEQTHEEWRHVVAVTLGVVVSLFLYWNIDRRLMAVRAGLYTRGRGRAAIAIGYLLVIVGIAYGLGRPR